MKRYVIVMNEISYGCLQEVIILRMCRELPNVDVFTYHIVSRMFMNISEFCVMVQSECIKSNILVSLGSAVGAGAQCSPIAYLLRIDTYFR